MDTNSDKIYYSNNDVCRNVNKTVIYIIYRKTTAISKEI